MCVSLSFSLFLSPSFLSLSLSLPLCLSLLSWTPTYISMQREFCLCTLHYSIHFYVSWAWLTCVSHACVCMIMSRLPTCKPKCTEYCPRSPIARNLRLYLHAVRSGCEKLHEVFSTQVHQMSGERCSVDSKFERTP